MTEYTKRVLIVDDEEDLTWSLSRRIIRDNPSIEVRCASSGNYALEMLSEQEFNLMLTDLRMPGLSGIDLLDTIKTRFPDLKIIVMTAYGSTEVKEELKRLGALAYLEKPFEFNELKKIISRYLEHSSLYDNAAASCVKT
jgi:DNA-binding NtrC family response regulator